MNWFTTLVGGGVLKKGLQQQIQAPNRNKLGKRAIIPLLVLAGSAVAYGAARRNGGWNSVTKPLRNRFFR